jgi:ABC-type sugar transport system ATPase subunit
LNGVTIDVPKGTTMALLGSSGCGKTTLLKLLAGLLPVKEGSIYLDGRDITRLPVQQRGIGFIQENWALYPHLTVFENCAFPLKVAKLPRHVIQDRINLIAGMLGISALLDRAPHQLSGGQKQRVAMARALVRTNLALLLADEPFSNLDQPLRLQLRVEFRRLQRELGMTCVVVSHDQSDAMAISDVIAFMHGGVVIQVGTMQSLMTDPQHISVAQFLGSLPMNLASAAHATSKGRERARVGLFSGEPIIGFRPEAAVLAPVEDISADFVGHVVGVERTYPRPLAVLEVGDALMRVPCDATDTTPEGQMGIVVETPTYLFDGETGQRLGGD